MNRSLALAAVAFVSAAAVAAALVVLRPGPGAKLAPDTKWFSVGHDAVFSSPGVHDLTGDGIADVVIASGEEGAAADGVVARGELRAIDGSDGRTLWTHTLRDQPFTTPLFHEIDSDGVADIVIGGRSGLLVAISGASGEKLWEFFCEVDPSDQGWFNFFTPQVIPDVDGDGLDDLVVSNGGGTRVDPSDERPPGHLMVMNALSGEVLQAAVIPGGADTLMSPLVYRPSADAPLEVLFGTGDETHPGSLWQVPLRAVVAGDLSSARELIAPSTRKGIMAPPALADLTGDGVLDIVASTFDGRLVAVDGASYETLWSHAFEGTESYASPALGYFDGDGVPDAWAHFNIGFFPQYTGHVGVAVSGATGEVMWRREGPGFGMTSPIAVDIDRDGYDEVFSSSLVVTDRRATAQPGEEWDFDVHGGRELWFWNPAGAEHTVVRRDDADPGATPRIGDLNGDGRLELIDVTHRYHRGAGNAVWTAQLLDLGSRVPGAISWGGYLGTEQDGRLHNLR